VPDVGADQRYAELMNLVQQLVEAALCGEPLPDLLHQILGDVDGAGTALVLEGELIGRVFGTTAVAAAGGGAAGAEDLTERAGEQGAGCCQAFEACLEHAAYQGGMVRDTHERPPSRRREPKRR